MKPHQIISLMTFDGADNTLVAARPRRPHPRRLPAAVRPDASSAASSTRSSSPGSGSSSSTASARSTTRRCSTQPSKYAMKVKAPSAPAATPTRATDRGAAGLSSSFVQLEFPWALGPGRRPLRAARARRRDRARPRPDARSARRAPAARRRAGARAAEPEPPPAAGRRRRARRSSRAAPFDGRRRRARWLDGADGEAEAGAAIAVLNRVLHAQRVAAADPSIARGRAATRRSSCASATARASRSPTGAGPRPSSCRRPPRRGRGATAALRPQERLAALLGGRDAALACEELDAARPGRPRRAAAAARPRCSCASRSRPRWPSSSRGATAATSAERLAELEPTLGAAADAAAEAALRGGLDDEPSPDAERVARRGSRRRCARARPPASTDGAGPPAAVTASERGEDRLELGDDVAVELDRRAVVPRRRALR